jgi:hypothetical protein
VQLSSTRTSAAVLSAAFQRTGTLRHLQFLSEFSNPRLDRRVVGVFDTGLGFVDQVIHDFMGNASELLGVCVCIGPTRCLRCAT